VSALALGASGKKPSCNWLQLLQVGWTPQTSINACLDFLLLGFGGNAASLHRGQTCLCHHLVTLLSAPMWPSSAKMSEIG